MNTSEISLSLYRYTHWIHVQFRLYLGCRPVTASNISLYKIAMPPHCHHTHSSRLNSDIVKKHKQDLHIRNGVGGDILAIGEFGKSYVEDEVEKADEVEEDIFARSAEGINLKDHWGEAMESIIQV